jgi:peroxiredoxin (alkyl hydroperoxide reductase subunit C)
MGEKFKAGCRPPVAPVVSKTEATEEMSVLEKKDGRNYMVQVGKAAPEFTLNGYHKGEFKTFSLSEFKGKWVLLCFYPGDFTFV